jgi:hypothetical protein
MTDEEFVKTIYSDIRIEQTNKFGELSDDFPNFPKGFSLDPNSFVVVNFNPYWEWMDMFNQPVLVSCGKTKELAWERAANNIRKTLEEKMSQ